MTLNGTSWIAIWESKQQKKQSKSKAKAKQQKTLYTSRFVRVILVGYPCYWPMILRASWAKMGNNNKDLNQLKSRRALPESRTSWAPANVRLITAFLGPLTAYQLSQITDCLTAIADHWSLYLEAAHGNFYQAANCRTCSVIPQPCAPDKQGPADYLYFLVIIFNIYIYLYISIYKYRHIKNI